MPPFFLILKVHMNDLLSLIARHGYLVVFAFVFAESIGLPVPAALALVGAGAAVASGKMSASVILGGSWLVMSAGDTVLYFLGRSTGWTLLGALCRLSMNPETCILRSAESFYKRGKMTLLFAKFVPGVNTMAPPLAGSMKMRPWQFLRFDVMGVLLYVTAYFALGFVFRDFLAAIGRGFQTAGHAVEAAVFVAVIGYVVYRVWIYRKNAMYRVVPRIQVEELAQKLGSDEGERILVVDVRSHGYYDAGSSRIKGSVRIEPNNLEEEIKHLPVDQEIYLYCT